MKSSGGYTLIEVVVSLLLTAVLVSSILSVTLSSKKGSGKAERKLIANQLSRDLTSRLKAYVTADPTTAIIPGPGTGANSWSMTSGSIVDSCGNCYALSPGSHTLGNFLPAWFAAAPYNAQATYFVDYPQPYSVANGTVPWVNVTISWTDP